MTDYTVRGLIRELRKLPKDIKVYVGVSHESLVCRSSSIVYVNDNDGRWVSLIGKKENDV